MKIKKVNTKKNFDCWEIGNNHEGSFLNAKKLIDMAANAGVDAVKFQTYKTEKFISKLDKKISKNLKNLNLVLINLKTQTVCKQKKTYIYFHTIRSR